MNELIFKRSIDIINQKDKPAKKELKAYFKYSLEMPKNAQKMPSTDAVFYYIVQ